VAGLLGWRVVYVFASAAMLLLPAILLRALPTVPVSETLAYRALRSSVLSLVRGERLLRQRMALVAAAFASACSGPRWRSYSRAPYHYGNAVIGLFGLAGLAGALIAPVAGRLADRGRGRLATTGAIAVLIASWGLLALDVAGSG
jgi:hypothetical protein